MSDFLSSLIDRALERAPVLERRRASLFEPAPGAEGLPSLSEQSYQEYAQSPAATPSGPLMPVQRPPEWPRRETAADAGAPRTPQQSGAEPEMRVRPQHAGEPQVVRQVEREHLLTERTIEVRSGIDRPAIHTERVVEQRVIRDPAAQPREPRLQLPQRSTVALRREPLLNPVPDRGFVPRPRAPERTPEVGRQERAATVPRPAPAAPITRNAAPPPVRVEQTAAEPTIQVTIGRVEIRATSAPAPVPAARAASGPKLKLEDYLRSRNGGGR